MRTEHAKVKARSTGQCEIRLALAADELLERYAGYALRAHRRCARRAVHIHHLISGIGRRNVGKSIEAAHKLHVCELHHEEIHGHVLKPTDEATRYDAATVRYERVR